MCQAIETPILFQGRKKQYTKLLVAENGPFGTLFLTLKSPRKSSCGSLFCILSQEMRHINSFLVAQNGGFWVGAKSLRWKSLYAFPSLTIGRFREMSGAEGSTSLEDHKCSKKASRPIPATVYKRQSHLVDPKALFTSQAITHPAAKGVRQKESGKGSMAKGVWQKGVTTKWQKRPKKWPKSDQTEN